MESHEQQKVNGGASDRPRVRRRGGGSTGLLVGIATVVVVGVAGKLLQRFNSINRSNKATAAVAKDPTAHEGQQSSTAVLKNVLSVIGDNGTRIVDGASTDAEEKYIGCDTPFTVEEKSRSRSFDAEAETSDRESFSENSDGKGSAEIQVKHPLETEVVAVDDDYNEAESHPPPCQKLETDLAAQTALPGLVNKSVKHETPFDEVTLRKAKDLQEVISRALADFGRGELSEQELADNKKLKLQLVCDDKPGPDAVEIAHSAPRSETPLPCDAQDNSEGSTYQSESESDLGNVASEFMDAHDTDTTATGDELEAKFVNAESEIEDTRMNSGVSRSESTDWPQAITFSEFINSVQATTSAESKDQVTVDDVPALADPVAESTSSVLSRTDGDLQQTDRHYFTCQDPTVVQVEAEFSLGESEAIYEERHEEAESVLRECETSASLESQEEAQHISMDNQIAHVSAAERQLDETESKSPEIAKDTEPAVGESLSSLEPEATTPSAYVDASAEEIERTTVHTIESESAKTTSEEKVVAQQQVTDVRNAQGAMGKKDKEDIPTRAKSSVVFLSKPCNPDNSFKQSRRHSTGGGSSAKVAKSAILTTMEFTSPGNKWGSLKHLEVLRMAVLIALIAAIIFMLREHHLKPLKHTA